MALFGKRKKTVETEEQMFAHALEDLAGDLDKRERKRRKRLHKILLPEWLDRRILIVLAVILVVILADAVRRENQEFQATLTDFSGQVSIQASEASAAQWAVVNQALVDDNVLTTSANSWATLEFPDGSVTTVAENSQLVVKLFEYSRGGRWRGRSMLLKFGRVWSNVGPNFGEKSEMKIHTPSAVAAVRGTQYSVGYDPKKRTTAVTCNDGYVQVDGFRGRPIYVSQGGQSNVTYGNPPEPPDWMSDEERRTFQAQAILNKPIPPELWIKTAELTLTQVLDAPLSILGIGKSTWAVGSADFARRTAAQEQLRRIMQFLEGYPTYPEFVNPLTLEELNIRYDEAARMLQAFNGASIMKYETVQDCKSYRMVVQARDKRRTMYELTPSGVRKLEEG